MAGMDFAFAPAFDFALAPFPCPFPLGLPYGAIAVDDAEVLAGPNVLLGGGPLGADALGLDNGAGFGGGGGPGFVGPCVSAS